MNTVNSLLRSFIHWRGCLLIFQAADRDNIDSVLSLISIISQTGQDHEEGGLLHPFRANFAAKGFQVVCPLFDQSFSAEFYHKSYHGQNTPGTGRPKSNPMINRAKIADRNRTTSALPDFDSFAMFLFSVAVFF